MEGVDRNTTRLFKKSSLGYVTLRMEGVDRNTQNPCQSAIAASSPSAWRVWIEIFSDLSMSVTLNVTLRMEGVDRNTTIP